MFVFILIEFGFCSAWLTVLFLSLTEWTISAQEIVSLNDRLEFARTVLMIASIVVLVLLALLKNALGLQQRVLPFWMKRFLGIVIFSWVVLGPLNEICNPYHEIRIVGDGEVEVYREKWEKVSIIGAHDVLRVNIRRQAGLILICLNFLILTPVCVFGKIESSSKRPTVHIAKR